MTANLGYSELIFRVEELVCASRGVLPDEASPYFSRSFFLTGKSRRRTLPQFEPGCFASGLSAPHPSGTEVPQRLLTRLSPPDCAPPPLRHRLGKCVPIAIHLRRSFLRYRPSASRSGRGVAEESLMKLRTAPPTVHEARQQESSRLVLPPLTERLAASAQPPGIIGGGFPPAALLRSSSLFARPGSFGAGLEGGGKGALSCRKNLRVNRNSDSQAPSSVPFQVQSSF